MSAPILQPGDQVHLVRPMHVDPDQDKATEQALIAAYAALGVNVAICTALGRQSAGTGQRLPSEVQPRIVAVFRKAHDWNAPAGRLNPDPLT